MTQYEHYFLEKKKREEKKIKKVEEEEEVSGKGLFTASAYTSQNQMSFGKDMNYGSLQKIH